MFFPVFMYGCERRTIKKAEQRRIDTFEFWCGRRLETEQDMVLAPPPPPPPSPVPAFFSVENFSQRISLIRDERNAETKQRRLNNNNVVIKHSHGEGNGDPLQYSCLENPMDGGAWWAVVHGVAKSQT